jgi:glycosyltransferase involved in cell wall biosynthesis
MNAAPRKKCLLLTYQTPRMPGGGGEVRSFYMIQSIASELDVTLLNLGGSTGSTRVPSEIRDLCVTVIEPESPYAPLPCEMKRSRIQDWYRLLMTLAFPWRNNYTTFFNLVLQYAQCSQDSGRTLASAMVRLTYSFWTFFGRMPPLSSQMYAHSWHRVSKLATKQVKETKYDLIWAEHTLGWPFVEELLSNPCLKDVPVVLSGHNIEEQVLKRIAETESDRIRKRFLHGQIRLMRHLEHRAWRRASLIIQCSESDAAVSQKVAPRTPARVIPNGVNGNYFTRPHDTEPASIPTLLFTASFNYQPNIDATTWFVREVFPLVKQCIPEIRFLFAGANAASVFDYLNRTSSATITGVDCVSDPADIRPTFAKAWVYVVPLRTGGGTRLKILEAMSMQLPVISTTVGAEGVAYIDGHHLLLADRKESLAEAIVQLIRTPELRKSMADNAAQFAKLYDWSQIAQKTRQSITDLLSCRAN